MSEVTEAKSLINNEAFTKAVASVQQRYISAALSCKPRDDEGRRLNLQAAKIVAEVINHLVAMSTTTETEPMELPDFYEERARKRFRDLPLN